MKKEKQNKNKLFSWTCKIERGNHFKVSTSLTKEGIKMANMAVLITLMEALKALKAARMATETAQTLKEEAAEQARKAEWESSSREMMFRNNSNILPEAIHEHVRLCELAISLRAPAEAAKEAWKGAVTAEEAASIVFKEAAEAAEKVFADSLNVEKAKSVIAPRKRWTCQWW